MKYKNLIIRKITSLMPIILIVLSNHSCSRNSEQYVYQYEYNYANGPDLISERYYKNDTIKYVIKRRNYQIYDSIVYKYELDSIISRKYQACSDEYAFSYDSLQITMIEPIEYALNEGNCLFMDKYRVMSDYYAELFSYLDVRNIREVKYGNEHISFYFEDVITKNNDILCSITLHIIDNVVFSIHYEYDSFYDETTNRDVWIFFDYKDGLLQSVKKFFIHPVFKQIVCNEFVYKYGKENALHYVE